MVYVTQETKLALKEFTVAVIIIVDDGIAMMFGSHAIIKL
jgi:predicted phosphoribosyltransferase